MAPGPYGHRCRCRIRRRRPHSRLRRHRCRRHRRPRSPRHRRRGRRAGFRHSRSLLRECQHIRTRRWRQVRCRCRTRRVRPHSRRRRHRCRRHRRPLHSHHHRRRGRRAGCRHSRSLLRGCQNIRTPPPGRRCRRRKRRSCRHSRLRRHRCRRHRRPLHSTRHRRRGHRAGFRHSRSLLRGCQNIRTRRWRLVRCRCRTRRVRRRRSRRRRHRCHRHRRPRRSHHHRRRGRRAGCRRSRSLLRGCRTSALVDGARSVADAALVEFADTVVDVVTDAIGVGVRHARPSTDAERVKLVAVTVAVSFGNVRTSALVDGARSVADAALVEFASTSVHVIRRHRCRRHRRPQSQQSRLPNIRVRQRVIEFTRQGASSWLPSQSQSPSGMSEHPHS